MFNNRNNENICRAQNKKQSLNLLATSEAGVNCFQFLRDCCRGACILSDEDSGMLTSFWCAPSS